MNELMDVLHEFQDLVEYGEGLKGMVYVLGDAMVNQQELFTHPYIVTVLFLSERMQEYQDYLRDIVEKMFAAVRADTLAKECG